MAIDPKAAKAPNTPLTPEQELARRSRRSFLALGAGTVGAVAGAAWIHSQMGADDIPASLRAVLGVNERVVRAALYSDKHLVRTYPASAIGRIKVNGEIGMDDPIDVASWCLDLVPLGAESGAAPRQLTIADIRSLPRYEEIIDFKCVEGWSTITQFAGARLSDFTAKFASGSEQAAYVAMRTPSKDYYVGVDMPSALHPQSLLAYEMNGKPLEDRHGAPLRLVMAVKYGIKNIKRIGKIEYTNKRPADYWAEQGYDYYSGL
jgi:hypothetical protein